jgi:hypothetical protein
MAVTFFPDFAFSNEWRDELSARGLSTEVVAELGPLVAELKAIYEPGQVPSPVSHRDALAALGSALRQCSSVLQSTTRWTLDALNAEIISKGGADVSALWVAIRKYGADGATPRPVGCVRGAASTSFLLLTS